MRGMFRGGGGNRGRGFRGGPRGGGGFQGGPFQGGFQQNRPQNLMQQNMQPPANMQQQAKPQQQQAQQATPKPAQNNAPKPNQTPQKPAQPAQKTPTPTTPAATPKPAAKPATPAVAGPVKKEVATPAQANKVVPPKDAAAAPKPAEQNKAPANQQANKPFNQRDQRENPFSNPPNPFNQQGNFNQGNNFNQNNSFNNQQNPFNQQQNNFNRGQNQFDQQNQFGEQRNPFKREGGPGKGFGNRPFNMNSSRGGPRTLEERLNERVSALSGPTYELPPKEEKEVKFSGHCRLYVGNITNDTTEEDIQKMFSPYGETSEIFVNKDKNFAFVKMDFRSSAEKAKSELDGTQRRGKNLKIRFAPHGAIIKVKNLTPYVSNELLEMAFSVFGEIEKAYVITDERGKSTGAGIVEFQRKPAATLAVRKCQENCFFLTSALRPAIVEMFEEVTDPEGLPDKNMFKKSGDFTKEREVGPRFANINSFEHDYGTRWKQLFELRKQKIEAVEREMKLEEEKMEAQMEYAKYEHETEMLREQLRQREMDRDRQKRDWEIKEQRQEEQRRRDEELMRHQQEEMQVRMMRQEEDLKRRQAENTLFMQAHQLNNLLDKQEAMMGDDFETETFGMRGSRGPGNLPVDPKAFMDSFDGNNMRGGATGGGYSEEVDMLDRDMDFGGNGGGGGRFGNGRGSWDYQSGNRRSGGDDFPNKRARRH